MKKLTIIILLFLPFLLYGQGMNVMHTSGKTRVVAPAGFDGGMITDGAFASGNTYWTEGANWVIAGGVATFDDLGTSGLSQSDGDMQSSIQNATAYTLTFTLTGTTGSGIYMRLRNAANNASYTNYAEYTNGEISIPFTTPADVQGGGIMILGSVDGTSGGSITNIRLTAD